MSSGSSEKYWVLGEILEVPAAERAALYIRARPEHEADALVERFARDGGADLAHKLHVPAAGGEHSGGETGRGPGAVHAQHVSRARLPAQAVRPVGHHERVQAQLRHSPGMPAVRALADPYQLQIGQSGTPQNIKVKPRPVGMGLYIQSLFLKNSSK